MVTLVPSGVPGILPALDGCLLKAQESRLRTPQAVRWGFLHITCCVNLCNTHQKDFRLLMCPLPCPRLDRTVSRVVATVFYTSDIPVSHSVTRVGYVLFNPGLPFRGTIGI